MEDRDPARSGDGSSRSTLTTPARRSSGGPAPWSQGLDRLADGLETDQVYSFNPVGEQGNEVELNTWCAKLDFPREMLHILRQAQAAEEQAR